MRSGLGTLAQWTGRVRTGLLTLTAFGCIVAGVWLLLGLPAGLITAGVGLLLIEFLSGDGS